MASKTPKKKARSAARTAPARKTKPAPRTGAARKPAPRAKTKAQSKPDSPQTPPPHQPDFSALFEKMTAPFMATMAQASASQNADLSKMTAAWIDAQRQHWQSAGDAFSPFGQMADMPGLGYFRERHEDFARFYKAWQAHDNAQQKYNAEMTRLMLDALAQFEAALANPHDHQQAFASLKDVYARWVNIAEEAYARFAASPAHAQIYGELVNTLAQLRHEMNVMSDQWAARLNLPTRTEIDSLHERMHDLRRENRTFRRQIEELLSRRPAQRGRR